jgi:hypothetical protein
MLQVPGQLNLRSIERSLSDLLRAPDQKVFWPMNVRGIALGGESALVQLMITWALGARKPGFNLPIRSLNEDQMESLVRQIHGLSATLLADAALDQSGHDHHEILQLYGLLKLRQLDGPNPRDVLHRQHDFTLLCADHLGRSSPRLAYLTPRGGAPIVRDEKYFRVLCEWIFKSIFPPAFLPTLKDYDPEAVGSLLHEVFENTDEHATRDIEGNILKKSVRGFFVRRHWLSASEIEHLTDGYPPLRVFCESIPTFGDGKRQLIEVSVFDSGPGLAQRLKNKPLAAMSTREEFDAVQDCFRAGVTTKTHSGHGIGLKYVVRLLRQKKGFMRVRTGRLPIRTHLKQMCTSPSPQCFRIVVPLPIRAKVGR